MAVEAAEAEAEAAAAAEAGLAAGDLAEVDESEMLFQVPLGETAPPAL